MEIRDKNGLTEQEFLDQYSPGDYERPSVAVDMVILSVENKTEKNYRRLPDKKLQLLMINRGGHPFIGQWALPGGFVEPDETTEQAAKRELFEETAAENVYLEQLYTFSEPDRDPRMRVMSCSYIALADKKKLNICAGDDAHLAEWFDVGFELISEKKQSITDGILKNTEYRLTLENGRDKLFADIIQRQTRTQSGAQNSMTIKECSGIAFDHAKIISTALIRLRNKLEYTDIALNLMPELFTMTELQQVYELILGRQLIKAPFRRKYKELAEETELVTRDAGHRPSRLYRKKWMF